MMPSLGKKYPIEIEVISKPKAEYMTNTHFELDLPVAPAVIVADEIVVEGQNVAQHKVEVSICRHLNLPAPDLSKKGVLSRLFGKS
jgi:hypothetical protein